LAKLQDDLGALHDAQIFGSEIAGLLAKELRSTRRSPARMNRDDDGGASSAVDRADALRAISQRLHRDEVAGFKRLKESWLDANVESLWRDAEAIADRLENKPRSAQRLNVVSG